MQGGRGTYDSSVLGKWGRIPRDHDGSGHESSGYESEVSVTTHLSLGTRVDDLIHAARTFFAVSISLPIAWITLHPSIGSFRARKFRVVAEGTKSVVALQQRLRHPVLDVFFQAVSFCAEEEFYLLVLPILFWNIDRVLGRRITLVVTLGLLAGNTMKDVFGLPRPASPPVWRPSGLETMDSTNLADFGFPSTHSMNAVSNSLVTFLYLSGASATNFDLGLLKEPSNQGMLLLCIVYILSMCISRLYVGAHSPTDVRGGLALGLIWTAVYFASAIPMDQYILSTPYLFPKLFFATIVVLLLNPQPRPVTPTFFQNSLLCGLASGCLLGSRHYADLGDEQWDTAQSALSTYPVTLLSVLTIARETFVPLQQAAPLVLGVVRTLFGFVVVLVLRVLAKQLASSFFTMIGISLNPKVEPPKRNSRKVRLLTRDIDILANAITKVFVYSVLAWAITFLVPRLQILCGMATYDAGNL